MRNGQFLVYAFSCVDCTSAMLHSLFLRYPHHRDAFGANWCYLGVLATFTLVESPLKLSWFIACTPGFHSTDLKFQKRGVTTMSILVANLSKLGSNVSKLLARSSSRMHSSYCLILRHWCGTAIGGSYWNLPRHFLSPCTISAFGSTIATATLVILHPKKAITSGMRKRKKRAFTMLPTLSTCQPQSLATPSWKLVELFKETFPIQIFVNFDPTVVSLLFTVNNLLLFTHIDQQSI